MSKVSITRSKLDSLADAIGSKSSRGIPLTIDQMRDAVLDIEIGITPSGTKNITKNGTYDVTEYASTEVNVSATEGSAYQDEDGYIVLGEGESSAPQGNVSITANGTYDVAQYAGASVEVPVGMTETDLKNYIERGSTFTGIDWPDGLTKIGPYAFAECRNFKPSSLPSGVTRIETYAFYSCTQLNWTSLPSGITYIGNYAFYSCINLALTSLPSGLTSINESAFRGCERLALTELSSNITFIGNNAFMSCRSLALTSLPSRLVNIGSNAFQYCTSLTSITCEGAITTLGIYAFNGNSTYSMSLTSVSFPNMALTTSAIGSVFGSTTAANACQLLEFCDIGSTTGIGSNAFANCHALETLVLRKTASVCTLANVNAFNNTPMRGYNDKTGKVYVPSALIESYKTATNWSTLYNAGTVEFVAIEGSEYER